MLARRLHIGGEGRSRGRTEIVEVVINVQAGQDAKVLMPELKRMLGDFSAITHLEGKQLLLRCDVGTLWRRLHDLPIDLPQ